MAIQAADCGADAVGLNFYEKSPRFITDTIATEIVRELPLFTSAVGVFVDASETRIRDRIQTVALNAVQTYSEAAERFDLPRVPQILSYRVRTAEDLDSIRQRIAVLKSQNRSPKAVLIDSFVPGEMGGTGHRAPWHLLVGYNPGVPLILAGGLTPDNVAEAVRMIRPWGVDVASGVESSPGVKDHQKMRAFVAAVREASRDFH
jgi:phosphoribosylanthranilate isomerase